MRSPLARALAGPMHLAHQFFTLEGHHDAELQRRFGPNLTYQRPTSAVSDSPHLREGSRLGGNAGGGSRGLRFGHISINARRRGTEHR